MNREDLQKLIQKEIQAVSIEYLRDLHAKNKAQATSNHLNSADMNDDEFDTVFFHGGQEKKKDEKKRGRITIKEGADLNLKITVSEIKEFENSFRDILDEIPSTSIVFDKQKNGYSILATKKSDGVEAKASGILNLGDNGKIIWTYSILNGFNLNAQNLKLSQSNKTMFEALYNHYDDWQKKWREKLNLPGTTEPVSDGGAQPADALSTDMSASGQGALGLAGGGGGGAAPAAGVPAPAV